MKDGTLDQAGKILALFKGTPREQIQALLSSGLLADLRDANIAAIIRNDFRQFIGLKSFSTPILTFNFKAFVGELTPPEKGWEMFDDVISPRGTIRVALAHGGNPEYREWYLGERHARALLLEQHVIPSEWRQFAILFPATRWRLSSNFYSVVLFYDSDGMWKLNYHCSRNSLGVDARIIRVVSQLRSGKWSFFQGK